MTSEPKAPMGVEEAVKRLTWMLGNAEGAANYDVLPDIDRDEASKDAAAFRVALAALAQPKEGEGVQTVDAGLDRSGAGDAPSSGDAQRLIAEVKRRHPSAFDGSDPIDDEHLPIKIGNWQNWVLACRLVMVVEALLNGGAARVQITPPQSNGLTKDLPAASPTPQEAGREG